MIGVIEVLFVFFIVILEVGDVVLLFVFVYLGYELIVNFVGVDIVEIDIRENDFRLIFEMLEMVII